MRAKQMHRASSFALMFCLLGASAPLALAQQERVPAPEATGVPEDVDHSSRVDADDLVQVLEWYAAGDERADLDGDGTLTRNDLVMVANSVADEKGVRFHLPEIPEHEVVSMTMERGIRVFLLREEQTGALVYLPVPFHGKTQRAGEREIVLPWFTGGEAQLKFDRDGVLREVHVRDVENRFVKVEPIDVDIVIEVETTMAESGRSLPPIGKCPGCVPLAPVPDESGDCVYLYSKWGLLQNCLFDCYGCTGDSGSGTVVCAVACCFESSGSSPDCDDDFGVPTP